MRLTVLTGLMTSRGFVASADIVSILSKAAGDSFWIMMFALELSSNTSSGAVASAVNSLRRSIVMGTSLPMVISKYDGLTSLRWIAGHSSTNSSPQFNDLLLVLVIALSPVFCCCEVVTVAVIM